MAILLEKTFSPTQYKIVWEIELHEDGVRLDQFIKSNFENWSREVIKKKIKCGDVSISNRTVPHRPNAKVHTKEVITLITNKTTHEDEYWKGELLELQLTPDILFEADDLVVISKPTFMTTHPTGKRLFNCATVFFEDKYKKTIHSIHRLDRETSGVLLLGRNPACANDLTKEFENSQVLKCYFFIARKNDLYNDEIKFVANQRLMPHDDSLKRVLIEAYPEDSSEGKHASTQFHILENEKGIVMGLAFPKTGRQHQIRVHAQIHGLPLIGDKIYLGGYPMFQRFKDGLATDSDHDTMEHYRHALHSIALRIKYKNKFQVFQTNIPKDLADWIKRHTRFKVEELETKCREAILDYFNESDK
jgi:23S rRNA pseudouridine1911/1915/1917 synthase